MQLVTYLLSFSFFNRYELDKRRAIENEDYDLAKSKKLQMDEYRLRVYQQLQRHNLLHDAGISPNLPEKDGVSPLKVAEGKFFFGR